MGNSSDNVEHRFAAVVYLGEDHEGRRTCSPSVCSSRFRQTLDSVSQNSFSPSCDNDGHCTTFNVTASTSSKTSSLRARHIRASERKPHHVVDANGNSMMVTVQTAYGFNITVHPAYASKFLKFFALLERAWL